MKALLLLSLLVSGAAEASALSVDLDADGRADSVRVVPGGEFQVLELALTSSGRVLRVEGLVGRVYDELSEKERGETSYCSSLVSRQLVAGAPGAFQLREKGGDYEGCAGSWYRTLVIRLVGGELVVTRLLAGSDSWSMGDPSPILNLSFNFAAGRLSGDSADHHLKQEKPSRGSVPLTCGLVPLAAFAREAFPACARAAAAELGKKINMDCGRAGGTFMCPSSQ